MLQDHVAVAIDPPELDESIKGPMGGVKATRLTWSSVSLTIPGKGRGAAPRRILSEVCGEARCGVVTVILGPTGSGKSSLLNALSGRLSFIKGARLTGRMSVNGRHMNTKALARMCAYVEQEDSLFSFLTVQETLLLSAHFHLPADLPASHKEQRVDDVVAALGLSKVKHTRIGDALMRGVSGGERRRVCVAAELIWNPPLLLLDEPTSGLDSFQALSVMRALQGLSRGGRTVLAAIHQPRSAIFDLADTLILLTEGRTVYCGPSRSAVSYFSSLGLPCPASFNPADFFLDCMSVDAHSPTAEQRSKDRVLRLCQAWDQQQHDRSPLRLHEEELKEDAEELQANGGGDDDYHHQQLEDEELKEDEEEGKGGGVASPTAKPAILPPSTWQQQAEPTPLPWHQQFSLLLGRAYKQGYRNHVLHIVKVVMGVVVALLLGAVYWHHPSHYQGPLDPSYVQNFIGLLFFMPVQQAFASSQLVSLLFPSEKVVVHREHWSGSYSLSAYYLSRLLCQLPLELLSPLAFSLTCYRLVGLHPHPHRFLLFLLTNALAALAASSLGLLIGAASPTTMTAMILGPPCIVIFFLFGGLFVNLSTLPPSLQWLSSASFVRWAFQALAINQFTGLTFHCPSPITNCEFSGRAVLHALSFDDAGMAHCLLALVAITCTFLLLAYAALYLQSRPRPMAMTQPPEEERAAVAQCRAHLAGKAPTAAGEEEGAAIAKQEADAPTPAASVRVYDGQVPYSTTEEETAAIAQGVDAMVPDLALCM